MKNIEEIKSALLKGKKVDLSNLLQDYDVNSFDAYGNNILHYFIKNKKSIPYNPEAFVNELIINGIDLNKSQNKSPGRTALHWAVFEKDKELVNLLLSLGAFVDVVDEDGNTPLSDSIFAFKNDDSYFIEILLANGADKIFKNKHGVSPLDLSRMISNYNSSRLLEEN